MDFRQIEAFCAVVEWGSFSEAAKQLYITQPTISSHIRTLEETLNTRLIERTTKSLTITPEGRQFYEYAKSLLRLREKTLRELLKEPYLMREDGSGTKKEADQFLETLGLDSTSLHVIARMNDLESIKQSIIYGLGISILSKKVTKDLERDNRVLVFPLAQGGIYRNYYLVYRKSKILNQQLWNFIQFVEGYFIQ